MRRSVINQSTTASFAVTALPPIHHFLLSSLSSSSSYFYFILSFRIRNVLLCVSVTSNRLSCSCYALTIASYVLYIIKRRRRRRRYDKRRYRYSPEKPFPIIPRTASASAAWVHQNYADKHRVMNNQSHRRRRRHRRNRRQRSLRAASDGWVFLSSVFSISIRDDSIFFLFLHLLFKYLLSFFLTYFKREVFSIACLSVCVFFS